MALALQVVSHAFFPRSHVYVWKGHAVLTCLVSLVCKTWLLIELTPKGVVFSFVFLSNADSPQVCCQCHVSATDSYNSGGT